MNEPLLDVIGFVGGLVSGFGGAIAAFFNDVNFVTRTPEKLSYNNDLVKQFGTAAQVLANGLLAVVTLVGGFNVMLRPTTCGSELRCLRQKFWLTSATSAFISSSGRKLRPRIG